jgi:hypothetical protein
MESMLNVLKLHIPAPKAPLSPVSVVSSSVAVASRRGSYPMRVHLSADSNVPSRDMVSPRHFVHFSIQHTDQACIYVKALV